MKEFEEFQDWLDDIRSRHPFAKMSKEEILKILRQTREEVAAERALRKSAIKGAKEPTTDDRD